MSGARHADSGNFPLGHDAEELGPVDLNVILAELRKRAVLLGDRGVAFSRTYLNRNVVEGILREFSLRDLSYRGFSLRRYQWRQAPAHLRILMRYAYGRRRDVLAFGLTHFERIAPPSLSQRLREVTPVLPWAEPERGEASEAALQVLAEFAALDEDKQVATARNVALLWDCFVEEFGGVSGFLEADEIDQAEYLEKLSAAAERMEAGRGTPVAYHYVSVVLM